MCETPKITMVRKKKYKELLESGIQLSTNIANDQTNAFDIFATIDTITDFANALHQECKPNDIDSTQQAIIDINILKSNTESLSKTLEQDECQDFSEKVYIQKLKQMVTVGAGRYNWKILAEQVTPMINTIKYSDCLYKTFEAIPIVTENVVKEKRARHSKHIEPLERANMVNSIVGEKSLINKYDSIHQQILQYCKGSKTHSLPYFKLTIDPHDFMRTIEINLAVAFILRSNSLTIKLGTDGYPEISITADTTITNNKNNSSALSMNPQKWKELIKFYKIKEPMLKLSPN